MRQKNVPGVRNGVIVDAAYWLWVDEQRRNRFGELAGRIAGELRQWDEDLEDPYTRMASCEMVDRSIGDSHRRVIQELLDEVGMTPREFDEELQRRTSPKYAYQFGSVEDLLVVR